MQALATPEHDKIFGVESLLQPGATIVYETLFSLRHSGRVIDLILHAARESLKASPAGEQIESRLRHCLELAVLNSWMHYRKAEFTRSLEIEVGWDSEKIVFSVAGFVEDGVGQPTSESTFMKYLASIEEHATELAIRHQETIGHLQVFASLFLDPQAPRGDTRYFALKSPLEAGGQGEVRTIAVPKMPLADKKELSRFRAEENAEDSARGKVHQRRLGGKPGPVTKAAQDALARLRGETVAPDEDPIVIEAIPEDFSESTSETVQGENGDSDSATVVAGFEEQIDDAESLVKGSQYAEVISKVGGKIQEGDDTKNVVSGHSEKTDKSMHRVSGGHEVDSDEDQIVSGKTQAEDKTRIVVSGGPAEKDDVRRIGGAASTMGNEEEDSLDFTVSGPKKKQAPSPTTTPMATAESIEVFEEKKYDEHQEEIVSFVAELEAEKTKSSEDTNDQSATAVIENLTENIAVVEKGTADLDDVIGKSGDSFQKTMVKYQQVVDRMPMPDKLKEYMKSMMDELTKDRAEFELKVKEVNSNWKKAQLEFKTAKGTLETEIQKRDAQIRQKSVALDKSREMLDRSMKNLEKVKQEAHNATAAESTQREQRMRVVLDKSREQLEKANLRTEEAQKKAAAESNLRAQVGLENTKLQKQVDDLQRKLAEASKAKTVSKEDPAMKAEIERGLKQVDELKRQNKLLQEKLTQATAPKTSTGSGKKEGQGAEISDAEMKHKLEQTQKLHKNLKDDFDKVSKRLEESRQAESKLKLEVSKLQTELKVAQKGAAKK